MKFRLVVLDIDGTITRHVSSWQYLHERLGQWADEADEYQKMFLDGKISYRKFCRLDAAHWKGMEEGHLFALFREVPYARNVEKALDILKHKGFMLAAVSTGIQFIVERVRQELDFDYVLCNELKVCRGRLTGGVRINIGHLEKGKALEKMMRKFNIPDSETIVVGDSAGDVPMMERAGYAISFNANGPEVERAADYRCRSDDFMEVCLKILEISGL
ncbi:MAG: HAD-IB family phosphatase [Candidatus Aminicenantes bacterium]|nr:HAD-IB family phosphatase [Candidatus Aminicenantes bacterium]